MNKFIWATCLLLTRTLSAQADGENERWTHAMQVTFNSGENAIELHHNKEAGSYFLTKSRTSGNCLARENNVFSMEKMLVSSMPLGRNEFGYSTGTLVVDLEWCSDVSDVEKLPHLQMPIEGIVKLCLRFPTKIRTQGVTFNQECHVFAAEWLYDVTSIDFAVEKIPSAQLEIVNSGNDFAGFYIHGDDFPRLQAKIEYDREGVCGDLTLDQSVALVRQLKSMTHRRYDTEIQWCSEPLEAEAEQGEFAVVCLNHNEDGIPIENCAMFLIEEQAIDVVEDPVDLNK